jgi:hypothetical protein
MNWFKKLFRKKRPAPMPYRALTPEEEAERRARLIALAQEAYCKPSAFSHYLDRPSKSLPPQDVETICREEGAFAYTDRTPVDDVMRGLWLAGEIARLKRNKKKFSHLQAGLEEMMK